MSRYIVKKDIYARFRMAHAVGTEISGEHIDKEVLDILVEDKYLEEVEGQVSDKEVAKKKAK